MMAAALSCSPGAGVSHRAGAAVWDLGPWPTGLIDISVRTNKQPRPGIRLHVVTDLKIVIHDGFPVTTPMRTLTDLAGTEPKPRVERAFEQAERLRLLDVVELEAECHGRRGSRLLKQLITEGREAPASKTELERALLDVCHAYDISPPSLNAVVHGEEVDAYWSQYGLVVELDSWDWHRTRGRFENDRRRDAKLAAHGIRVLRFTWRQLRNQPDVVAEAVRSVASSSTAPSRGSSAGGSSPPRSVPAISSSGAFSFGMKPDFMPK
jgi:very-short-patch-repair endonuclease